MFDAADAMRQTRHNLTGFFNLMTGGAMPADEIDFMPALPHVPAATYACSHFHTCSNAWALSAGAMRTCATFWKSRAAS